MQQSVLGHLAAVMTGMTKSCRGYIQRCISYDSTIAEYWVYLLGYTGD